MPGFIAPNSANNCAPSSRTSFQISMFGTWLNKEQGTGSPKQKDILLAVVLFIFAAALRLPYLLTSPGMTDEYKEITQALNILQFGARPLVQPMSYIGPVWMYLNAALFRIFGTYIFMPRLTMLVFGTLTVVVTYFLARVLIPHRRSIALLAALFLAVNPQHIYINSHVAWSNAATPFFSTFAILAYIYATRRAHPSWLIVAAILFALAAQTHPLVLALTPAFLVDFLWEPKTRMLLRTFTPYLAVAVALLVYSPLLYYNLSNNFGSLRAAGTHPRAFEPTLALNALALRLVDLSRLLGYVTLGTIGEPRPGDPHFTAPGIAFFVIVLITAVWFMRRHDHFPPLAICLSSIALVIVNQNYAGNLRGRYVAFLLPLIFIVWGAATVALWNWAGARVVAGPAGRFAMLGVRAAVILAIVWLLISSPLRLNNLYVHSARVIQNETLWLQMVSLAQNSDSSAILLDSGLAQTRTGQILRYYFRLENQTPMLVDSSSKNDLANLRSEIQSRPAGALIAPSTIAKQLNLSLNSVSVVKGRCLQKCPDNYLVGLYVW